MSFTYDDMWMLENHMRHEIDDLGLTIRFLHYDPNAADWQSDYR